MIRKIAVALSLVWMTVFHPTAQINEKTVYLIPGQGSDYRVFKHFEFSDHDTVHIQYIIPVEGETMRSYAEKLAEQIDRSKPYSIIGLSLGGMLAVEMSDFLEPEEVIIISSAKSRHELPIRYKFMKKVPVNNLFGGDFLNKTAPAAQLIVEPDSQKERDLCKSMLDGKNSVFMKRSVNMIINWQRTSSPDVVIHIHGDNDHTIPLRNIKDPDVIIRDGSHMMALTKGEDIRTIAAYYLN
jgi:hypothetical protein